MKKSICFFASLLAIVCYNLISSKAFASDKTKDNFFPAARLTKTSVLIANDAAFSLLVEGGPRNYRFNGTVGFIADYNRFKVSTEYLCQKLHFGFHEERAHHWVHQFAVGGLYQHLFECPCWIDGVQFGISYSNSGSKELKPVQISTNEFNLRRIAGAWNWTTEVGFLTSPWRCATLVSSLSYDQVHYKRSFEDGKRISGIGFGLDFTQKLWTSFALKIDFQFKQAYNNLEAALQWTREFDYGNLDVSIFTHHVWGKRKLPSSTTAGIGLGFAFGISDCSIVSLRCCPEDDCNPCSYNVCDLLDWVNHPAVYMPQVLAISDQTRCTAPSITTEPFASAFLNFGQTTTYAASSYFTSGDSTLTYTADGLPEGSSINPETGLITLVNNLPCGVPTASGTIFVTAFDDCGSQTGTIAYTLAGASCP